MCASFFSVSQYSDENMMQPYNLAVCFGPSLLRGMDADDAVARQPQVNDLVKTMILQHDIIFPGQSELPGPVYEKHMTLEQEYWWGLDTDVNVFVCFLNNMIVWGTNIQYGVLQQAKFK